MGRRGGWQPADGSSDEPAPSRDFAYWAVALGGFGLAMFLSWRAVSQPQSPDLRSPLVLLVNAAVATAIAFGYAADRGALATRGAAAFCLLYGLWSAAAFRLVPPVLNLVLFYRSVGGSGPNWPAALAIIAIGSAIQGGIVLLMTWPHARRVLGQQNRALWSDDDPVLRLVVTTLLVFFTTAAIIRLIAAIHE
jgi:hypothetical protein